MEDDRAWFRKKGFDVALSQRELHAEAMAKGEPGKASFFRPNLTYVCVALLRDGQVVASDYASGETEVSALRAARRRYAGEQT